MTKPNAMQAQEGIAMSNQTSTEIQKSDNRSVAAAPEQTRSGPVYSPAVDIFENDASITVLAELPGVRANDLKIDLRENVLTLMGRVAMPETTNENSVSREYEAGMFFRQFTLGETIDQSKIDAKLANGVLRLELPKEERARPRQISVRGE